MDINKIIAFARKQGYDSAEKIGEWKGYEVYEPFFDGDGVSFIGLPTVILIDGEKIRLSTTEESLEINMNI